MCKCGTLITLSGKLVTNNPSHTDEQCIHVLYMLIWLISLDLSSSHFFPYVTGTK